MSRREQGEFPRGESTRALEEDSSSGVGRRVLFFLLRLVASVFASTLSRPRSTRVTTPRRGLDYHHGGTGALCVPLSTDRERERERERRASLVFYFSPLGRKLAGPLFISEIILIAVRWSNAMNAGTHFVGNCLIERLGQGGSRRSIVPFHWNDFYGHVGSRGSREPELTRHPFSVKLNFASTHETVSPSFALCDIYAFARLWPDWLINSATKQISNAKIVQIDRTSRFPESASNGFFRFKANWNFWNKNLTRVKL